MTLNVSSGSLKKLLLLTLILSLLSMTLIAVKSQESISPLTSITSVSSTDSTSSDGSGKSTGVIATSNEYSSLRDTIMSKGIDALSTAIFNMGIGIDKNIVKLVSTLPRLTLYNYGEKKLDTRSAPKVITNFDITNQTSTSLLVDYSEGVGAYGALGLICFGILLVELCCCIGTFGYTIGTSCCCRLRERDQKFRLANYSLWAKDHEKRRKIICAFRILLLVWVILNVALLVVWFVFAYQSNIEISTFMNKGIERYNDIEAIIASVLDFAKNLPTIVTQVETQYNQFKTSLLSKLPTTSKLSEWSQCVNSIRQQVPSIDGIDTGVQSISTYLSNNILNRIAPLQNSIVELRNLFLTVGNDHVDNLKTSTLTFQSSLIGLSTSLTKFATNLDQINTNLAKITYIDESITSISTLQSKMNYTINPQFFSQYEFELSHMSTESIVTLSNVYIETQILQYQLSVLRTPINNLINNLISMNGTLSSLPTYSNVQSSINELHLSLNQIQASDLTFNNYNTLNTDVNQTIPNKFKLFKDDVRSLIFAINSIPSLQFVYDVFTQLTYFNSILQQGNCIDTLIRDVKNINDTFVELPSVNIFDYYSSTRITLNTFVNGQVTNYYNSLNGISSSNTKIISSISDIFNTTLDLSSINMLSLQGVLPIVPFKKQLDLISISSMNSTLNHYYNLIDSQMDLMNASQTFNELNSTMNAIDSISLDNFIYLLGAAISTGKTTCANDVSSTCSVLNSKALQLHPKVVNLRIALSRISNLEFMKTSLLNYKQLIKSTIQTDHVKPLKIIHDSFNFNSAFSMLTAYGYGIKQIGSNLPLQRVSDGLASGNSTFTSLPLNQFSDQVQSCKPMLDLASQMDISVLINQFDIATFSSYLNLGTIFTNIINTLANVRVKTYIWWKDEINYQLNNIYFRDILKWDGYRLLGVIVFISFIVLLPIVAIFPSCCYRFPGILYFEIVCLMVLGLLGCAVIFFVLPFNIFLTDTCSNLEPYIFQAVDSYGSQFNATLSFTASFYKYNISFQTDIKQLADTYTNGCKVDQISDVLASIKVIVDDSPNLVTTLIASLGSNVKLRPTLVRSIQDTIHSLMNNLYTSLIQVADLVMCKNLSLKYENIKSLVCEDGAYFIATFWFLFALLTFLILINIAVYIIIYIVFRYFWYDAKIIVKSNILTSSDRTVILGNEERIHHHSNHYEHQHKKNVVRRVQNVHFDKELRDGIILEDI